MMNTNLELMDTKTIACSENQYDVKALTGENEVVFSPRGNPNDSVEWKKWMMKM
jgi:hypothetical protein